MLNIFAVYVLMMANASSLVEADIVSERKSSDYARVKMIAEAFESYITRVTATPPATLAALAGTSGYEYISDHLDNVGYSVTTLTDDRFTFQRAVIFIKSPGSTTTDSEYLNATNNSCGSQAFSSAAEWCKDDGSIWYLADNRKTINRHISYTINHMDLIIQQFSHAHRLNKSFPDETAGGTAIPDNSAVSLAEGANYSGSASACTGHFDFDGTPLSCAYLYDIAGSSYIYHKHDSNFITIYTQLPYLDNTGSALQYARNLEIVN